jgi:serine/threonine protein phosphatase PrpC
MHESHALTCSFGMKGDHRATVNADHTWAPGDAFLLCTDGFHGLGRGLPRATLRDAVRTGGDPEPLVRTLVRDAVTHDGRDNATLVYVAISR